MIFRQPHSFVFALALFFPALASGCKAKANASEAKPQAAPISIETAEVQALEVPSSLRLTGTLKGFREVDLAANAMGRVTSTSVERGGLVSPGQVLAKLDVRALALSVNEARAQVESVRAQGDQAQRECERYEQMRAKQAISELEYDRAMTQCRTLPLSLQAASARASLAAQNVGDGIIRAPFAGVATERYVEVGQYVRQDSKVATIVSIDPLRLELTLPESETAKVQQDADVGFRVAAYPERLFHGKIRFISGAVRATTRDLVVEAVVGNPDKLLKPGMFAEVELTLGQRKLPSIPKASVVMREGLAHAFFVIDHQLEERVLSLGPESGTRVAIQDGARLGESVAVGDISRLSNGQRVR